MNEVKAWKLNGFWGILGIIIIMVGAVFALIEQMIITGNSKKGLFKSSEL